MKGTKGSVEQGQSGLAAARDRGDSRQTRGTFATRFAKVDCSKKEV